MGVSGGGRCQVIVATAGSQGWSSDERASCYGAFGFEWRL